MTKIKGNKLLAEAFGEWLFYNASPSCVRHKRTALWMLNDESLKWNDRFKTTLEMFEIFKKQTFTEN